MYLIVLTNQIKKSSLLIISSRQHHHICLVFFAGINSTERIPLYVRKELICYSLK